MSLEGAMAMLEDDRYRGDLATEVNKLRKLLTEEKKKSHGESARLAETSQLFEQVSEQPWVAVVMWCPGVH